MSIKDTFSQAPSPKEEALYKRVLDEVEAGVIRKGIFAKALADCLGDEKKANSLYIKYRVQSLVDEKKYEAKHIAYERKQAAEQAKIEAIEKEERDKKLAEEKIRLSKEQYKEDNSHKGFIWKMKDGYFGFPKTFWFFWVIGNSLGIFVISEYGLYQNFYMALSIFLMALAYNLITSMGVFKAAKRYDGFKLWSFLALCALFVEILSLVLIVIDSLYFS